MSRSLWILSAALLAAQALAAQPPAELPHWPRLDGGAYVFFMSNDVTLVNGTAQDLARARGRRTSPAEELFWFEREGKEHVIRNPATLTQIKAALAPLMRLGQQQAALTARQAQLGREQTALEGQQSALLARQNAAGDRMAILAGEQVRAQEAAEDTSAVEAEMQVLEQEQELMVQPLADLASRREELFRQVQWVARQQAELNQQEQQATAEAERLLPALVSQALAQGTAKAVK